MAAKTSPQDLMHLAYVLNREAARLDAVRDELHQLVRSSHGEWEGLVADRFRGHAGAEHRQRHLEVARDRLRRAARLVMEAANDAPGSDGTSAPGGSNSNGGGNSNSGGNSHGGATAPKAKGKRDDDGVSGGGEG